MQDFKFWRSLDGVEAIVWFFLEHAKPVLWNLDLVTSVLASGDFRFGEYLIPLEIQRRNEFCVLSCCFHKKWSPFQNLHGKALHNIPEAYL